MASGKSDLANSLEFEEKKISLVEMPAKVYEYEGCSIVLRYGDRILSGFPHGGVLEPLHEGETSLTPKEGVSSPIPAGRSVGKEDTLTVDVVHNSTQRRWRYTFG